MNEEDAILRELSAPLSDRIDPCEATMAAMLVSAALGRGYRVSVHDGCEWPLRRSTDYDEILRALGSTDADTVSFRDSDGSRVGAVFLVWGNGPDLFSDWTDSAAINSMVEPIAFA